MSDKPFYFQKAFPLAGDKTEYELISTEGVSTSEFQGEEIRTLDIDLGKVALYH